MYTEEDIVSAIAAGVLSEDRANAFRAHVEKSKANAVDEEHFRLIGGFNDIFVVIACVLLLISVTWIGGTVVNWVGALAAAVVAWGLAEFFTRQRKMALPSIVLLLAFVINIYYACFLGLQTIASGAIVAAAFSALGAWLHWLRFKVPITVAAGAAACVALINTILIKLSPDSFRYLSLILLISGLVVFFIAMLWDGEDINRQTRKSDVAFWLHLLAAPLIVHPVFSILGILNGHNNWYQVLVVIVLYIIIAVISLAIDRRALMVSALAYVLFTFSSLLKDFGVVSLGFAIAALVIGSALLLLSAFWHPSRKFVLEKLPASMQKNLP
jgi:MFS family permease